MKSTYTFVKIEHDDPRATDLYREHEIPQEWFPILRVDSQVECGHSFKGVALVVGADSPNPALMLPKPLGFNAVRDIMTAVSEFGSSIA